MENDERTFVPLPPEADFDLARKAVAYAGKLFSGDSGGHDLAHSMRVLRNAVEIARTEDGVDFEVVVLASLLHDVDDRKLFRTENFGNARRFLESEGVEPERAERIVRSVSEVSFGANGSASPSSIESAVVRDADRLDALGAIGVARTFAYGGSVGRPLDDSIRHFGEKLLLLKDLMVTAEGRRLAERRHSFLVEFLREYGSETGIDVSVEPQGLRS